MLFQRGDFQAPPQKVCCRTAELPIHSSGKQEKEAANKEKKKMSFGVDFGQKVDLTASIRNILRNYPEGTSILKV
jgi:hypothetical protein